MVLKTFFKTRAGQRIDQPDFEHVADRTPRDVAEQLGQGLLTGADTNRNYVLSGFAPSVNSTTVTVAGGIALLSYRDQGELRHSALVTDGAASRSVDIGSFPDATYFVYVASTLEEGTYENRAFWDTTLNPDAETTRTVATKRTENWTIAVETVSPGDEWMKIAQVVKAAGSLTLTDQREFYFEGSPVSSPAYSVTTTEWGTNDDRNANRATYGVKSLRKFVRAVQRQLTSIIGGTNWWSAIPAGADLTTLLSSKLARDGSQTMQGNLLPDGNSTRNLGSAVAYWLYLYATNIETSLIQATGRFRASGSNAPIAGGGRSPMLDGIMSGLSPNNEHRIIYQNQNSALVGYPAIEIAINAAWQFDLGAGAFRWSSTDTTVESYLYVFGRGGIHVLRRLPSVGVWTDTLSGAGWSILTTINNLGASFSTELSATNIEADYLTLVNSAPGTPLAKTSYADMLVIARGTVITDGIGGVTASTAFNDGVNFTPSMSGSDVQITFITPVSVTGSYQVFTATTNHGYVLGVGTASKSTTGFRIFATTTSTGAMRDLSTNPSAFDFVVIGG